MLYHERVRKIAYLLERLKENLEHDWVTVDQLEAFLGLTRQQRSRLLGIDDPLLEFTHKPRQ